MSLITVEVLDKETGKVRAIPVAVNPTFLKRNNQPDMLEYIQRIIDPRHKPVLKPLRITPRYGHG